MESPLWPALYPLRADPVPAEISLDCGISLDYGTDLNVPPTVEVHLKPSRGSDK
ncbi:hypothetical protein CICLE_v10003077mg [Citrus x clementina]|uniref:Uncharacterized protein n=1 Tax=Citrus clementina TaxID=85681 RepID=V4T594_CITCL|nr:hypothetical protein CICLE_v10003077mg [Citrus x clementina]